jgi:hypothetical protein
MELRRVLKNNQGQALIESLALCAALGIALALLLAILYFGFVHIGMNYLLHELLVCKTTQGESRCENQFRKKAEAFLFAAKILDLECHQSFSSTHARVVLQMPMKKTLTLKKELGI